MTIYKGLALQLKESCKYKKMESLKNEQAAQIKKYIST